MKAIIQDRYGTTDVLQLRDIDPPEIGDDGVLIRVRAAGLDPGVWHTMSGQPYLVRLMGYGLLRPRSPVRGWDVAGQVEAVGREVSRFQPGDEVFGSCRGSFAEYAAAREHRIVSKPPNLSFEEAAVIATSGLTALQALRDHGELSAGQHVLIIGAAGGVGSYAVQLAKVFGAHVTGVCSTSKVDLVRSIGADEVIDYTRVDITRRGDRYDLVIDTAGNRPLSALRRVLHPKGTLVIVGGESGGRWSGGLGRTFGAILISRFVTQRLRPMFASSNLVDLTQLAGLVEEGLVLPVIDRIYALAEVPEAINYLQAGHGRGKVAIRV